MLRFYDTSTLILCHLPEKGRREIGEIVEEMKEVQGRKRNGNEREDFFLFLKETCTH